ncbi:MAG: T9SS type A sorting domain-containing protein [Bacteroidota bacterium]
MKIFQSFILLVLICFSSVYGQLNTAREEVAKRSEVVFFHRPDQADLPNETFAQYQATWTGWGYGYNKRIIDTHHDNGVKFMAGISAGNLRTTTAEAQDLLDAVCLDLNGELINSSGTGFLGISFYRMCINDPLWQGYLKRSLETAISNGADGVKFDTPCGSPGHPQVYWTGAGCSCEDCMAMFRTHLDEKYSEEELAEFGIEDIDSFDYFRDIVKKYASTREEYKEQFGSIPLLREFIVAQQVAAKNVITGLNDYARTLSDDILMSTNAWHLFPYNLYGASFADVFVAEMPYGAEYENEWVTNEFGKVISPTYKLGEALGKPLFVSPTINDWKNLQNYDDNNPENDLVNLSKLWIAGTYALGAHFMVPLNYDWTSHNYYGQFEDYGPIYSFISDNNTLFDGYELTKKVGVLYDNASAYNFRHPRNALTNVYLNSYHEICGMLTDNQMPWGVVAAGGDLFIDNKISKAEIEAEYEFLVVPENSLLLGGQKQVIDELVAEGKAMYWNNSLHGISDIHQKVAPVMEVESPGDVWILPRESQQKEAPLVLHVLSKEYDKSTDLISPQSDLKINLKEELFSGKKVVKVVFHTPEQEELPLSFSSEADGISLSIPELAYWGIIEIQTATTTSIQDTDVGTSSLISVYPNPSTGMFTIEAAKRGKVELYDVKGGLVRKFKIHKGINQLDTEGLTAGIYSLVFERTDTIQLVIQ